MKTSLVLLCTIFVLSTLLLFANTLGDDIDDMPFSLYPLGDNPNENPLDTKAFGVFQYIEFLYEYTDPIYPCYADQDAVIPGTIHFPYYHAPYDLGLENLKGLEDFYDLDYDDSMPEQ